MGCPWTPTTRPSGEIAGVGSPAARVTENKKAAGRFHPAASVSCLTASALRRPLPTYPSGGGCSSPFGPADQIPNSRTTALRLDYSSLLPGLRFAFLLNLPPLPLPLLKSSPPLPAAETSPPTAATLVISPRNVLMTLLALAWVTSRPGSAARTFTPNCRRSVTSCPSVSGEPREPETLIPSLPSSLTAASALRPAGAFGSIAFTRLTTKSPVVIGAVFVDGAANAMDPTKQRLNAEPTN